MIVPVFGLVAPSINTYQIKYEDNKTHWGLQDCSQFDDDISIICLDQNLIGNHGRPITERAYAWGASFIDSIITQERVTYLAEDITFKTKKS